MITNSQDRIVAILDRIVEVLDGILRKLLAAAFGVILVVTLAQVLSRYFLATSFVGTAEIARYLMVATTFLAIPVLTHARMHIAVDALSHYLPNGSTLVWLQRLIFAVETLFYTVFANYAFLAWSNYRQTGQASPSLSIPLSWPSLTLGVGALLGALLTATLLVRTVLVPADYAYERHDQPPIDAGGEGT